MAVEGTLSPGWGLSFRPRIPTPSHRSWLPAAPTTGGRCSPALPFPDLTGQTLQRQSKQTGLVRPGQEVQNKGGLLLSAVSFRQMINCESNYIKKKKKLEQKGNKIGYTLL